MLRPIYRAVLETQSDANSAGHQIAIPTDAVASLSRADKDTGMLQIDNVVQALAVSLRDLQAGNAAGGAADEAYLSALKSLRELAARIGDDLKLTLDPVLDTYHVQNIVVIRLPTALEEIGQAQLLTKTQTAADDFSRSQSASHRSRDAAARKHGCDRERSGCRAARKSECRTETGGRACGRPFRHEHKCVF